MLGENVAGTRCGSCLFLNCTANRSCKIVCLPSPSEVCLSWPLEKAVIDRGAGLDLRYSS